MAKTIRILFTGLGLMGRGTARDLVRNGFALMGEAARRSFVPAGAPGFDDQRVPALIEA